MRLLLLATSTAGSFSLLSFICLLLSLSTVLHATPIGGKSKLKGPKVYKKSDAKDWNKILEYLIDSRPVGPEDLVFYSSNNGGYSNAKAFVNYVPTTATYWELFQNEAFLKAFGGLKKVDAKNEDIIIAGSTAMCYYATEKTYVFNHENGIPTSPLAEEWES